MNKQNTDHSTTGVESFIEQGKKELRVFLRAIQVVRDKDTSGAEEWFEEYSESLLSQAKREERDSIRNRVGFLRQWLNEDRITDKKPVTNEGIEHWLHLTTKEHE